MDIRRWVTVAVAALVLVACANPAVQTVARLDNVVLTRPDLDKRIALIQSELQKQQTKTGAQPQQGPLPTDQQIEQQLVGLFIQENLVLSVAHQRGIAVSDKEVDSQIAAIRTRLEGQGANLDDAIRSNLGLPDATSPDFRQFISSSVAQQKLEETLVTTDTVKAKVAQQVQAEASRQVEQVHSAHILFRVQKPEDDQAALEKAKQVIDRLNKGEKFEDLAKQLSQDPGSASQGGDLSWAQREQLDPTFAKAIFDDLKPGETTQTPVKSQYGYHVIKVIERGLRPAIPADQVQQIIDQQVAQQLPNERQQALQDLITNEHKKAKDDGRLEEPTYPTPEPASAPGQTQPSSVPAPSQEPTAQP